MSLVDSSLRAVCSLEEVLGVVLDTIPGLRCVVEMPLGMSRFIILTLLDNSQATFFPFGGALLVWGKKENVQL